MPNNFIMLWISLPKNFSNYVDVTIIILKMWLAFSKMFQKFVANEITSNHTNGSLAQIC